jgi:hypothetical protein
MGLGDSVQAVVNALETGRGRQIILGVLVGAITLGSLFVHGKHTFRGLSEPEAMEHAQLARNLARGNGFRTQCLRPVDFWYTRTKAGKEYAANSYPDIRSAPGFPVLLAGVFSVVNPRQEPSSGAGIYDADWRVVAMTCIVLTTITAALVFVLGTLLFDYRIGVLAFMLFVFTKSVLDASLSGTADALATMLSVSATILAVCSAQRLASRAPGRMWVLYVVAAGLMTGLAVLTDHALLWLALGISFMMGRAADGRRRWLATIVFVVVLCMALAPWFVRNVQVSGSVAGPASLHLLEGSGVAEDEALQRSVEPVYNKLALRGAMAQKLRDGLVKSYDLDLRLLGNGLVLSFFLVSLFCPLLQPRANDLRWGVLIGVLFLLGVGAAVGTRGGRLFSSVLPHAIVFASVFFMGVTDREPLVGSGVRSLLVGLFVVLTALPGVFSILRGPRETYPPYYYPFVQYVCSNLKADEILCTDIPWATAWYGDRTSVLLPRSIKDFEVLHEAQGPFAGLYLTQETQRQVANRPWGSMMLRDWLPVADGVVPEGFPLQHGVFLPPGRTDQLFLADRARWPERKPSGLAEDETEVRYREED